MFQINLSKLLCFGLFIWLHYQHIDMYKQLFIPYYFYYYATVITAVFIWCCLISVGCHDHVMQLTAHYVSVFKTSFIIVPQLCVVIAHLFYNFIFFYMRILEWGYKDLQRNKLQIKAFPSKLLTWSPFNDLHMIRHLSYNKRLKSEQKPKNRHQNSFFYFILQALTFLNIVDELESIIQDLDDDIAALRCFRHLVISIAMHIKTSAFMCQLTW